jgi:shikimate dehydrogenase
VNTNGVDRYGVMGYPISHSRSPVIHRLFALQTGQSMQYDPLQVAPDQLDVAVRHFEYAGGKGLNITLPHKHDILRLTDHISNRASVAGAVNTLVFRDDQIFGDNTDGIGLLHDLQANLGLTLKDKNILILGAGGATRGIIAPLLEANPASLTIANRTLSRAKELVKHFAAHGSLGAVRFREVGAQQGYDLVINATSAGLKGETPPYPEKAIRGDSFCYDLSYGLTPTPFSLWASKHGARQSIMGWGMLVEQAAESFHLWRGIRPDTESVLSQLTITA